MQMSLIMRNDLSIIYANEMSKIYTSELRITFYDVHMPKLIRGIPCPGHAGSNALFMQMSLIMHNVIYANQVTCQSVYAN
jgi:hypothetical protein